VNCSELNFSKYYSNLICSLFLCDCNSDLLLPFVSYEQNSKFLGFIRGSRDV
jgi:hypothetical protein